MNAAQALLPTFAMSRFLLLKYLEDFSDAESLIRPVAGANHTAWQLGHVISEEYRAMQSIRPGVSVELPKGFAIAHSKAKVSSDDANDFYPKASYLEAYAKQYQASVNILQEIGDDEFAKPSSPEFHGYAPTIGSLIASIPGHWTMHIGQIIVIRRKLGKKILI